MTERVERGNADGGASGGHSQPGPEQIVLGGSLNEELNQRLVVQAAQIDGEVISSLCSATGSSVATASATSATATACLQNRSSPLTGQVQAYPASSSSHHSATS